MEPPVELNSHEARVLGVLAEKAFTTPDQYPLSINATVNGCNQKSNRHPVVDYTEAEVHVGLTGLLAKGLAGRVMPAGGRVEKFRHNALESLRVTEEELAVLTELMLRGAQSPGELRARVSRMKRVDSLEELGTILENLTGKGLARSLGPAPGSRSGRHQQTVAPEESHPEALASPAAAPSAVPSAPRAGGALAELTAEVETLRKQVAFLADSLGVDLPS